VAGMGSEQGWAGGPRSSTDALLRELVDRADEVLGAQAGLRGLLDAVVTIATDLSLPAMLRRIVQAACNLADAGTAHWGCWPQTVTRWRISCTWASNKNWRIGSGHCRRAAGCSAS